MNAPLLRLFTSAFLATTVLVSAPAASASPQKDSLDIVVRVAEKFEKERRTLKVPDLDLLIKDLDRAVELHPTSAAARMYRASIREFRTTLRFFPPPAVMTDAEKAERLAIVADAQAALPLVTPAQSGVLHRRLAQQYFEIAERSTHAAADYDRVIENSTRAEGQLQGKDRTAVILLRASSHAARDQFAPALQLHQDLIQADPKDPNRYRDRARVFRRTGELDRSVADIVRMARALRAARPSDEDWNTDVRLFLDEHRKAIRAMLESQPKTAADFVRRGAARIEARQLAPALEDLNAALALEPEHGVALTLRARVAGMQNQPEKALQDAELVLKKAPQQVAALYARGLFSGVKGDLPRLVEDLTECIRLDPEQAGYLAAYENRAKAYRAQGKTELAAADEAKHKEFNGFVTLMTRSFTDRLLDGK